MVFPYTEALSLSPSPNSLTELTELYLVFCYGLCFCFYQLLDVSSQSTIMLGSCLQAGVGWCPYPSTMSVA